MITIRHDDYDWRLDTSQYIEIHEAFLKAGLIETLAMQWSQWGRICTVKQDLVDYINNTPGYDIQLHGFAHFHYDEWEYDFIVRDLAASIYFSERYFKKRPTIWFPPWNCMSNNMERAAAFVGMEISNESNDIWRFIREAEVGKFSGKTLYFHGWKKDEMELFPRMLELAKAL